jgi:hypothetical protein
MSGPATNSDNLFRRTGFTPVNVAFKINQSRPILDLPR